MASGTLAVVVVGGGPLDAQVVAPFLGHGFRPADVVCADSGLDHARAAGLTPSVLIGDLDSISSAGRAWAETHQVLVIEHPIDKSSTDTELALRHAAAHHERIVVLAGAGDRLDHTIGALTALGHDDLARCDVRGWWGRSLVRVVRGPGRLRFAAPPGTVFSVMALHGGCRRVDITGARWELDDARLEPGRSNGVSNEVGADGQAVIAAGEGVLTVIAPDGLCTLDREGSER